jgi:hypothetical protein
VSGGGYIGAWLAAWFKNDGPEAVLDGLAHSHGNGATARSARDAATDRYERRQIRFLREYSNYLTPRKGLLGADTWTAMATYVRNLFLTLIVLVSTLLAVIIAPRILVEVFGFAASAETAAVGSFGMEILAGLLLLLGITVVARNLSTLFQKRREVGAFNHTTSLTIYLLAVTPAVVAAWIISAWLWSMRSWSWSQLAPGIDVGGNPAAGAVVMWSAITGGSYMLIWLIATLARDFYRQDIPISVDGRARRSSRHSYTQMLIDALTKRKGPHFPLVILFAFVSGAVSGAGLLLIQWYMSAWAQSCGRVASCEATIEDVFATVGIGLVMAVFLLNGTLHVGLSGTAFTDEAREWWSRLGASLVTWTLVIVGLTALALFGPALLVNAPVYIKALLGSAWLAGSMGGILAGRRSNAERERENQILRAVIRAAPFVFVIGLLLLLSTLAEWLLNTTVYAWFSEEGFLDSVRQALVLAAFAGFFLALGLFLSYRIGVNEFSMHAFYRNRLVRAYLGASNSRHAHPFTGFDPLDDRWRVDELKPGDTYAGPYPIFNAALNLVNSDELAWQQRKAASFVFTPLYSGYDVNIGLHGSTKQTHTKRQVLSPHGYRDTAKYGGDLSLGTVMAISGAAASPNMGYHTSGPVAFLMTVFNMRLGWWLGNPRRETWQRAGPRIGFLNLLYELSGRTDDRHRYVYLSDGGHFENLGVYELVKRRCRYIVACDASEDCNMAFVSLGNAIEKCRTDLGIEISIDVDEIRRRDQAGLSEWHCAVGTIDYNDGVHPRGTLLYIKPSLTGDEPTDILRYAARRRNFPHEPTADQWFGESQFESYRALGRHITDAVFAPVTQTEIAESIERVFVSLRQHWYPKSEAVEKSFTKHGAALGQITRTIRESKDLAFLDAQLNPSWSTLTARTSDKPKGSPSVPAEYAQARAGFLICQEMCQLMENVYVDLQLDSDYNHPDNRGWINLFRHWATSCMFRITWAMTASTYGGRFQTFVRRRLNLSEGTVTAVPLNDPVRDKRPLDIATVEAAQERKILNALEADVLRHFLTHNLPTSQPDTVGDFLNNRDARTRRIFSLQLVVDDLLGGEETIAFPFGFALVADNKLEYLRVRDHLRKMGLGRAAIRVLVERHNVAELNLKAEIELRSIDDAQPTPDERRLAWVKLGQDPHEFEYLFESVMAQREQERSPPHSVID